MADDFRMKSNRERLGQRLGLAGNAYNLDDIRREDYKTEAEYIAARAMLKAAMSTKEYKIEASAYNARQEREAYEKQREADRVAFEEAVKGAKLERFEIEQIDRVAREKALRDYSAGRIASDGIGERASEYAKQEAEKVKRTKAANRIGSNLLRQAAGYDPMEE